jgi:pentatricopeptide repeat protein
LGAAGTRVVSLQGSRKVALLLSCVVAIAAYLAVATRSVRASLLAETNDLASVERATRLEPGNASHWLRLGHLHFFAQQQAQEAMPAYRRAFSLNPRSSAAALALATAAAVVGNNEEQSAAIEQAVRVDPSNPRVAWEAGNLFLARDDTLRGLRQLHRVLETDTFTPQVVNVAWRATHDIELLHRELLPPNSFSYSAMIDLLVAAKDTSTAMRTWNWMWEAGVTPEPATANRLIDHLIGAHLPDVAFRAWQKLNPADPDQGVFNGGFEDELSGGAFDWRVRSVAGITLNFDTTEFHHGRRSLHVTFAGDPVPSAGVSHLLFVRPNTAYTLSASMKSSELLSAYPPVLTVSDAYSNIVLGTGAELTGTTPWRDVQAAFKTGADTSLIVVTLARQNPATKIRGAVWIDDVTLAEQSR